MRILIIEDDAAIAANLYDYLQARGHYIDAAADGVTGLHFAVAHQFDVILLDLALPGIDGLTLCRKLREEAGKDTPVLMLTARDTLEDKLQGFEYGADDYLIKPYALREVEARLTALYKRGAGRMTARELKVGNLVFNPRTLKVEFAGHAIKLPPKCIRLLEHMMAEPGRVFNRAELETALWGETQETSDNLRGQMHLLRRTLIDSGGYDPIETVHGMGYRLRNE